MMVDDAWNDLRSLVGGNPEGVFCKITLWVVVWMILHLSNADYLKNQNMK